MALKECWVGSIGPFLFDDASKYPDGEDMVGFRADAILVEGMAVSELVVTGAFGCNGATAQDSFVSGGEVTGSAGATYTAAEQTMLGNIKTLVNNIRSALVANGIMT